MYSLTSISLSLHFLRKHDLHLSHAAYKVQKIFLIIVVAFI